MSLVLELFLTHGGKARLDRRWWFVFGICDLFGQMQRSIREGLRNAVSGTCFNLVYDDLSGQLHYE